MSSEDRWHALPLESKNALRRDWEAFLVTSVQSRMLRVFPGSIPATCDRCGARIYRIVVNGKAVEADCNVPDGLEPSEGQAGYAVSHVSRCAARHVKRERRGR